MLCLVTSHRVECCGSVSSDYLLPTRLVYGRAARSGITQLHATQSSIVLSFLPMQKADVRVFQASLLEIDSSELGEFCLTASTEPLVNS